MKTRTALPVTMLWIMLSLVFTIQISRAQNTPAGAEQNEPALSGSTLRSEDVATKADAVFVGQITHLGFSNLKALGEAVYRGLQVKVLQVLRGSVDPQSTFTLRVMVPSISSHENPPAVGSTYIFFVKKDDPSKHDAYTVLKLLPATDDNIAKVKAVIAAAPAGK